MRTKLDLRSNQVHCIQDAAIKQAVTCLDCRGV